MKIAELTQYLEQIAPSRYQESYDNSGLIIGHLDWEVTGVLTCLDSTEAVVEEAMRLGCNLVVAHHPIIFGGLKRLTYSDYIQKTVAKAIKHDIAIYAIHTNLDNVYLDGVNAKICSRLGLKNTKILSPKRESHSLLISHAHAVKIKNESEGFGQFTADYEQLTDGMVKLTGPVHMIDFIENCCIKMAIPFDRKEAFDKTATIGSGMIGELPVGMGDVDFLHHVQEVMNLELIKYTKPLKEIRRVAVCGGSGGFLLGKAISAGADAFITSDYKYHEFFDANGRIMILDIGHYESEYYTIELLYELISKKFANFAVHFTKTDTNPVKYFVKNG